jgi:hypothetical protein
MGYAKRNKRHAQESMMKKKIVGHMKVQVFEKTKKRKEIAHVQRKKTERDGP